MVVFALAIFSFGAPVKNMTEKCGAHPSLLRDESGSPVWFSSTQLYSLAVKPVMAEPVHIKGLTFNGSVSVKIMVGTSGDVVCIWDAKGHPLMLANAVKAAHDWKFKPKIENGKPSEFVGTLELPVSANEDGY
jgi:hypothetical protein